jgi:hypothetical protein
MISTISTVVEISEVVHSLMQAYLDKHPKESSDQVVQMALEKFMKEAQDG